MTAKDWIPSYILPSESGNYLVYIAGIAPSTQNIIYISYFNVGYGWQVKANITHWMPLPAGPEKGE